MLRSGSIIAVFSLLTLVWPMHLSATGDDTHDRIQIAQVAVISPHEAAAFARARTGGRVLDVRADARDGRQIYLVKLLLADGRIRVITIDAVSGRAGD